MKTVGALSQRYKEISRKMFMAEGEVRERGGTCGG